MSDGVSRPLVEPTIRVTVPVIDTHAHLTSDPLPERVEEALELCSTAGVQGILSVGIDVASSRRCIALAERFPQVRAAVGIHPNDCCRSAASDWEEIRRLCRHHRVAALGETGLDRYWDDCPWEVQVDYLHRHIALSREVGLPIVIHTRECAEETLAILQSAAADGPLAGVMHSFTGCWDVAAGCLELGFYISFAGMVTFKNADALRNVARRVPGDRLLVETDSPYLTPHPFRGKRPNHPALVTHTLACLAEVRGTPLEQLAAQTTANAERLFGRWD
ncbi:MAG: TatD family deoxyribonuclease [Planctomycetota bacterium]|nr:MAG: TatD family deoxyribonuclease [Planctomycetota bacterium]